MISKRAPQPEEVHRSAAVDLGDIVLQAAGALRANRGIVRAKIAREVESADQRHGENDSGGQRYGKNEPRRTFGKKKASHDRFNSPARKASAENTATLEPGKRPQTRSWQKSAPDPEKLTAQHAYLRAIALLCGRDYSSKKMAEKLAKCSFASEAIDQTLIRLRLEGALSDARFAASRTNGLVNRGKGPRAIQAKLKEAGLAKELITHALGELEIDWAVRARELLSRKFGDTPAKDHKDWAKRARFLIARGFDEASVRNSLKAEKT